MTTTKSLRKIFDVYINEQNYGVYDIEGKEHQGLNNTPKTWWVYYDISETQNIPGVVPAIDSDNWEPYCVGILRQVWDIRIKQRNTTKVKWGGLDFRNHTSVEMWCNGKLVYEFGTGGKHLDYAMAKIQYLQVQMNEHPYNFFKPEKENGRKICWYGLPATVKVKHNTWEIGIIPDYTTGISRKEWWEELRRRESKTTNLDEFDKQFEDLEKENNQESETSDYINWGDALSDANIYWFRK